jgi:hypothetical protein
MRPSAPMMTAMPQKAKAHVKILLPLVDGDRSPYPVVVSVTTAKYRHSTTVHPSICEYTTHASCGRGLARNEVSDENGWRSACVRVCVR